MSESMITYPSLNMLLKDPLMVSHRLNSFLASIKSQCDEHIIKPVPTKSAEYHYNSEMYKLNLSKRQKETNQPSTKEQASHKAKVNEVFGKKFENLRQSVIRHFKKTMRRLHKKLEPTLKLEDSACRRNKKTFNVYKKLYHLTDDLPDLFEEISYQIILLGKVADTVFCCSYGKKHKSCNSKYIEEFFSNHEIVQLYHLHHQLMMKSDIYFTILKIKKEDTDFEALGEFIKDLPFNF